MTQIISSSSYSEGELTKNDDLYTSCVLLLKKKQFINSSLHLGLR